MHKDQLGELVSLETRLEVLSDAWQVRKSELFYVDAAPSFCECKSLNCQNFQEKILQSFKFTYFKFT